VKTADKTATAAESSKVDEGELRKADPLPPMVPINNKPRPKPSSATKELPSLVLSMALAFLVRFL